MKQLRIPFAALLLLASLLLAACGAAAEIDSATSLADDLYATVPFSTELFALEPSLAESLYAIPAGYEALAAYSAAGDAADQIVVVTAADEAAAKTLLSKMEAYMHTLSETYSKYAPEQCPRIEGSLLSRVGRTVVWCVSDDTDAAKTIMEKHYK